MTNLEIANDINKQIDGLRRVHEQKFGGALKSTQSEIDSMDLILRKEANLKRFCEAGAVKFFEMDHIQFGISNI